MPDQDVCGGDSPPPAEPSAALVDGATACSNEENVSQPSPSPSMITRSTVTAKADRPQRTIPRQPRPVNPAATASRRVSNATPTKTTISRQKAQSTATPTTPNSRNASPQPARAPASSKPASPSSSQRPPLTTRGTDRRNTVQHTTPPATPIGANRGVVSPRSTPTPTAPKRPNGSPLTKTTTAPQRTASQPSGGLAAPGISQRSGTLTRLAYSNRPKVANRRSMSHVPQFAVQGDLNILGGVFGGDNASASYAYASRHRDTLESRSALDAIHTSHAVCTQDMCLPGTRVATLEHLRTLLTSTDLDAPDVIWMHGPAGAGKSAVMRSMARIMEVERRLLASFFFFRSDNTRCTSAPFIPTLAFQLCSAIPQIEPLVLDEIQTNRAVFTQSLDRQSTTLLANPIVRAHGPPQPHWLPETPVVIIIDGLDECTDSNRQVEIIKAMVDLAATIRTTGSRVKIIIASRPEHRIRTQFRAYTSTTNGIMIFALENKDANIPLYYDVHFDILRDRHMLPQSWPSREQILWLISNASGQYGFAHCIIRFLEGGDPVIRLQILQGAFPAYGLKPYEALDRLYSTVLSRIPPELRQPALLFLSTILHSEWRPYQASSACLLLGLPPDFPTRISVFLSSLIDFRFKDGVVHYASPYHATLGEFLRDSSRAGQYSLYIAPQVVYDTIVRRYLSFPLANLTLDEWAGLYDLGTIPRIAEVALTECSISTEEFHRLLEPIKVSQLDFPAFCFLRMLAPKLDQKLKTSLSWLLRKEMEARMKAYIELGSDDPTTFPLVLIYLYFFFQLYRYIDLSSGYRQGDERVRDPVPYIALFIDSKFHANPGLRDADVQRGWNIFGYCIKPILQELEPLNYSPLKMPDFSTLPDTNMQRIREYYQKLGHACPKACGLFSHQLLVSSWAKKWSPAIRITREFLRNGVETREDLAAYTHCEGDVHSGLDTQSACQACVDRLHYLQQCFTSMSTSLPVGLACKDRDEGMCEQAQLFCVVESSGYFTSMDPEQATRADLARYLRNEEKLLRDVWLDRIIRLKQQQDVRRYEASRKG